MTSISDENLILLPANVLSVGRGAPCGLREEVAVIVETPIVVDVIGGERYTLMSTPSERRYLAAGFLLTEGMISSADDIQLLSECEDDPCVVRVKIAENAMQRESMRRNLTALSACGACGTDDIDSRLRSLTPVGRTLKLSASVLQSSMEGIRAHQPLFNESGGAHWVGLYNADGVLTACAEDIGRHNALDKAVGKCLLSGTKTEGCWAILSGRVSMEMAFKSAKAGIELIAAISAPTSLAVDIAKRTGITLCVFVREGHATVFTHPERIAEMKL